jgi:kynureninase
VGRSVEGPSTPWLLVPRSASQCVAAAVRPALHARRGSLVALVQPEVGAGYPIVQALIARGVVGDFRAPDVMRFGFTPLYLRYTDVWDATEALHEVVRSGEWREERFARRNQVT